MEIIWRNQDVIWMDQDGQQDRPIGTRVDRDGATLGVDQSGHRVAPWWLRLSSLRLMSVFAQMRLELQALGVECLEETIICKTREY